MQQLRLCKRCGEQKPDEKFPNSRVYKDDGTVKKYREHACYSCKHKKEYERGLKKDPLFLEKKRIYKREYNLKNPEAKLVWNSKNRAKKKGFDFNIDVSDIILPEFCPLIGIPLYSKGGVIIDNSPSLDRIDSKKGYVKGNVWVISHKANTMKSDATLEELELLVNNLRKKMNEQKAQKEYYDIK